jgi:hypothetical protein
MGSWRIVTYAHCEKREVRPVQGIEIFPTFNVRVDSCSSHKIDKETDRLKHQGPLTNSQLELLVKVTSICTVDGYQHQRSDEEVQPC